MDFKLQATMLSHSLKRLNNKWWTVIKSAFGILGVLSMIADIEDRLFGSQYVVVTYRSYTVFLMLFVALLACYFCREKYETTINIEGSPDVAITIKVGDALDNEGAVIIPTNTTFDTKMDDDFISEASLQGQYQKKYFPNSLKELDALIAEGMEEEKMPVRLNDGRKTKLYRYPIGTVSKISGKNVCKRAYFLANSDIDKRGKPKDVEISDLTTALDGLWDALAKMGNMETYTIPLIGTGRAAAKNAPRDEIAKQIIISFLMATQEYKITENLIISIHPSDFEKIHWNDLCEYLKYQCLFGYHKKLVTERLVGKVDKTTATSV